MWAACAYAQDEKGCEGVGFAKQSFTKYSPEGLQKQLEQNQADVDALINLRIRLEEQGQSFLIGIDVGLLLAAPFLCFALRKRRGPDFASSPVVRDGFGGAK